MYIASGEKCTIKPLLCNIQYFILSDSDMYLNNNNNHRKHCCVFTSKFNVGTPQYYAIRKSPIFCHI
jgi:hypothetical protein